MKNEKDGIGDNCDGVRIFNATGGCTCIRIGIDMIPKLFGLNPNVLSHSTQCHLEST